MVQVPCALQAVVRGGYSLTGRDGKGKHIVGMGSRLVGATDHSDELDWTVYRRRLWKPTPKDRRGSRRLDFGNIWCLDIKVWWSVPKLVVTAHYIHSPGNQPNNWKLCSWVLGYTEIQGSHSSANTAAVVMWVIDCYGLRSKVCLCLRAQ